MQVSLEEDFRNEKLVLKNALQEFFKKFNEVLADQQERDHLYNENIKNLRFRILNGRIKNALLDLGDKEESIIKLYEIKKNAMAEDEAEDEEEKRTIDELTANLRLVDKKEARMQKKMERDITVQKSISVVKNENVSIIKSGEEEEEDEGEMQEELLTPEEEAALDRFKQYEHKIVSLLG